MLKITITEQANFGHWTNAQHVYEISESLKTIHFDRDEHKLVIDFSTCSDKLVLDIGRLKEIKIEEV